MVILKIIFRCFIIIVSVRVAVSLVYVNICSECTCESSQVTCEDIKNISLLSTYDGPPITSVTISKIRQGKFREDDFNKFSETLDLIMESNNLEFDTHFLNPLRKLVNLYITKNNRLPMNNNIFEYNRKLVNVDLSDNDIHNINSGVFHGLKKLLSLKLNGNAIQKLSSDVFQGLERLEELELRGNQLEELEARDFAPLKRLRVLDLRKNRVAVFGPPLVKQLAQLPGLRVTLEENPLLCDCGPLRAAWAEWVASDEHRLNVDAVCPSGTPWEEEMRMLECDASAEEDEDEATAQETAGGSATQAFAKSGALGERPNNGRAMGHAAEGATRGEEVELAKEVYFFIVLLILVIIVSLCLVVTLITLHCRVTKTADEISKLTSGIYGSYKIITPTERPNQIII